MGRFCGRRIWRIWRICRCWVLIWAILVLAEWERDSLDEAVKRVVSGEFSIEERMTIAVQGIGRNGESLGSGWALNEVSVENQNRSGVLDAILEVDGRPVSSFGCEWGDYFDADGFDGVCVFGWGAGVVAGVGCDFGGAE